MENRRDSQASCEAQEPRPGDCSANFIPRRVGRSMWDRRMRVTIFPQDSTTVLSGVYIYGRAATNEKEDGAHLFPLLSRGYLARTCETLTERVFPTILRTFITCYFSECTAIHPVRVNTIYYISSKRTILAVKRTVFVCQLCICSVENSFAIGHNFL